jgi:hypothetical protein
MCAAVLLCGNAVAEDFSAGGAVSLVLNSLTMVDGSGSGQLRFSADTGASRSAGTNAYSGLAINRSLAYFFIGLGIPDDKLWVNLKPGGQDQIIDPSLKGTDLGKILLSADLTLKKDASEITNPRHSAIGRRYWDQLYAKAAELGVDEMPVANRIWITPGSVVVAEDRTSIRIVRSELSVSLETDRSSTENRGNDQKQRALDEYSSALMRELILPQLNKKVNSSPAYENLRQVYRAVILARWYRQRSGIGDPTLIQRVKQTVPDDLPASVPYTCDQIYREYMASLRQGEYNFSENTSGRLQAYMELITRRYFSGGVDLGNIVVTSGTAGADDRPVVNKSEQFSFDILLDGNQAHPIRYAMEQVKVMARYNGKMSDKPALLEENLPPVSPEDLNRQLIQNQDLAIHRVMSRNL